MEKLSKELVKDGLGALSKLCELFGCNQIILDSPSKDVIEAAKSLEDYTSVDGIVSWGSIAAVDCIALSHEGNTILII